MDVKGRGRMSSTNTQIEEDMDLRRGPWTVDEDFTLINYIANHGEGRWNSLARCAGKYIINHFSSYYSKNNHSKEPKKVPCFLFLFHE